MKLFAYYLLLLFFQFSAVDSLQRLARKGYSLENGNVLDEAEVYYKRALKGDRGLDLVKYNLGNVLYKQGRFQEALDQFKQVESSSDLDFELKKRNLFNIGTTYVKLGDLENGKIAFQKVLRLQPENNDARYNLAFILSQLAKVDESKKKDESGSGDVTDAQADNSEKEDDSGDVGENMGSDLSGNQDSGNLDQLLNMLDLQERSVQGKWNKTAIKDPANKIEKDW